MKKTKEEKARDRAKRIVWSCPRPEGSYQPNKKAYNRKTEKRRTNADY